MRPTLARVVRRGLYRIPASSPPASAPLSTHSSSGKYLLPNRLCYLDRSVSRLAPPSRTLTSSNKMTDSITTIDISVDSDDKFNIESTGRNSYELESTAFPGAIAGLQVVPGTAPPCIDIRHVNVPKEYRGKGVAETLVLKVVAVARARGMKIVPTCPYVSDTFFPRNPDIAAELKA